MGAGAAAVVPAFVVAPVVRQVAVRGCTAGLTDHRVSWMWSKSGLVGIGVLRVDDVGEDAEDGALQVPAQRPGRGVPVFPEHADDGVVDPAGHR